MPLAATVYDLAGHVDGYALVVRFIAAQRVPGDPGVPEPFFIPAPTLTISYKDERHFFQGGQFRLVDTDLGQIVIATVEIVPDEHATTLALLLTPVVRNVELPTRVKTVGWRTTQPSTIAGPGLNTSKGFALEGQVAIENQLPTPTLDAALALT